eukprot:jgi/Ulvmu1/609/UM001_0617.1
MAVMVPGWEVAHGMAHMHRSAMLSNTQAHLQDMHHLQRQHQQIQTESALLQKQPVLPPIAQTQQRRAWRPGRDAAEYTQTKAASDLLNLKAAVQHGQRRLRVWKATQAAFLAANETGPEVAEPVYCRSWDHATHALCSAALEDIIEKALWRVHHRPDTKMVQREKRQWQIQKRELQENMAQQLMLHAVRAFVQTTIKGIWVELEQERSRPMAFARSLLAEVVLMSNSQPGDRRPGRESRGVMLQDVLQHMQQTRDKACSAGAAHYRHTQALQMEVPEQMKSVQHLLASALDPPSKPTHHERGTSESLVIAAGPEPRAQHTAVAQVESYYWAAVKFAAGEQPYSVPQASGAVSDMAVHDAGFCVAVCTENGSLHVLDLRWGAAREIYTYPGSRARAKGQAQPAPARKNAAGRTAHGRGKEQAAAGKDLCGAAFGTMGHVAALRSNGSLLVFLLRPDRSSPDDPESPMTPMCLVDLPPPAQLATGKAVLEDGVTTVAHTTAHQRALRKATPGDWVQRVTIKTRPCYTAGITLTGAKPYIALPQATGDALCVTGPGSGPVLQRSRANGPSTAGTAVIQLLRAEAPARSVPPARQQLFRFHNSQIVFITSLAASGELLTVDLVGAVAVWPAPGSSPTGLGWLQPAKVLQLQRAMLLPQLGDEFSDTADDTRAEGQPKWMVMYSEEGAKMLRHVIRRPTTERSAQGLQQSGSVVETRDCASNTMVATRIMHVRSVHVPTRVVAAAMCRGQATLVLVTVVPAAEDAAVPCGQYFRFHSVSCSSWAITLPAIDVPDWSSGMVAPVFSITPQVRSLGSEYLLASLGLNVIGVFSLTSAQLLREVPLCLPPGRVLGASITQLAVFTLTLKFGASPEARGACKGRLAACFGPPVNQVLMFQVDDTGAEARLSDGRAQKEAAIAQKKQKRAAAAKARKAARKRGSRTGQAGRAQDPGRLVATERGNTSKAVAS